MITRVLPEANLVFCFHQLTLKSQDPLTAYSGTFLLSLY